MLEKYFSACSIEKLGIGPGNGTVVLCVHVPVIRVIHINLCLVACSLSLALAMAISCVLMLHNLSTSYVVCIHGNAKFPVDYSQ